MARTESALQHGGALLGVGVPHVPHLDERRQARVGGHVGARALAGPEGLKP